MGRGVGNERNGVRFSRHWVRLAFCMFLIGISRGFGGEVVDGLGFGDWK